MLINEWVILKDNEIVERNENVKIILEIAETKYKDIDIVISANFNNDREKIMVDEYIVIYTQKTREFLNMDEPWFCGSLKEAKDWVALKKLDINYGDFSIYKLVK